MQVFFVIGTHAILTVTTPTFYPTSFRSSANGLAMAIGKIGSIAGPVVGGMLMSAQMSLKQLYCLNSAALVIGLIIATALGVLSKRHYNIKGLSEKQKIRSWC